MTYLDSLTSQQGSLFKSLSGWGTGIREKTSQAITGLKDQAFQAATEVTKATSDAFEMLQSLPELRTNGKTALFQEAMENGNFLAARFYLFLGANIHARYETENSLLNYHVSEFDVEYVAFLLRHGAQANHRTTEIVNCHYRHHEDLGELDKGAQKIARLLIEHGMRKVLKKELSEAMSTGPQKGIFKREDTIDYFYAPWRTAQKLQEQAQVTLDQLEIARLSKDHNLIHKLLERIPVEQIPLWLEVAIAQVLQGKDFSEDKLAGWVILNKPSYNHLLSFACEKLLWAAGGRDQIVSTNDEITDFLSELYLLADLRGNQELLEYFGKNAEPYMLASLLIGAAYKELHNILGTGKESIYIGDQRLQKISLLLITSPLLLRSYLTQYQVRNMLLETPEIAYSKEVIPAYDIAKPSTTKVELLRKIQSGKPVALPTGWVGHMTYIVIYRDMLLKCNRGAGSFWHSGIEAFHFDPSKLTPELLIQIVNVDGTQEPRFFLKDLNQILDLKPLHKIRQKPQNGGNCGVASAKSSLLALDFALEYYKNGKDVQAAEKVARVRYKRFTGFMRARALVKNLERIQKAEHIIRGLGKTLPHWVSDLKYVAVTKAQKRQIQA